MAIGADSDHVTTSGNRLVFAYYVTGHGFGHATRVVEVVRHLINAGHDVHVVTGAPDYVFTTAVQSPRLFIRKVLLDCGAVQADALTVDRLASLEKYKETAVVPRESILSTEAEWLQSIKADLVISDVVPVACRAAADAGIRSVCVTHFSWDFIYAEYVMAVGIHQRSIVWQCHYSYSACGLGSDATDRLVQLVQEMHHSKKDETEDGTLYGSKITGGGCGGTVRVIGRNSLKSSQQIIEIQKRYERATGYMPFVFEGSSPGAGKFGYLKIRRRRPLQHARRR